MARRKMSMVSLKSWQEVDDALRTIGENERDISAIENVMNEQISAAKQAAADKVHPLKLEVEALEIAVRDYAVSHRGDMDGKKSKALTFGTVSFRQSTKIQLPKAKEKIAAIIEKLRALGMDDCIKSAPESVDKEVLKDYSADKIAQSGATLTVEDVFGYKLNEQEIRS